MSPLTRATASNSQRRAARRQRAAARQAWHFHKTGKIPLSSKQLSAVYRRLQSHHSGDKAFLRRIVSAMSSTKATGWLCGQCRKMKSPNAWYCDLCGSSWEECAVPTANQHSPTWNQQTKKPRERSQKHKQRPRSRKKNQQWEQQGMHGSASSWGGGPWSTTYVTDKGSGKGMQNMQVASPPPPPPPMLAPAQMHCQTPWMPQQMPQQMPQMQMMPFLPPQLDQQVMQTVPPQPTAPVMDPEDHRAEMSAQSKLNKIMKAAKKEDHLSPEFQSLVQSERKKDGKESTSNLLAAVKAHGKAKEALMEVESSRMQLWSQWRVFLQASVTKWKEYTAQFQASETAFQHQMQVATMHLKKA